MKAFRTTLIGLILALASVAMGPAFLSQRVICAGRSEIGTEYCKGDTLFQYISSPGTSDADERGLHVGGERQTSGGVDQEETSEDPGLKWHTMFTKIPSDWSLFATRTFRTENIPAMAGIAALTGALYAVDHKTYHHTHDYQARSQQIKSFSNGFVCVGDGAYQFGFIGTMALYGFAAGDSRSLRTASQMTEAVLATGVVVQVLKRIAGRESPIVSTTDRGAMHLFPNLADYQRHQPKYYSFPSGHIATATASLTVLCENFPEARWLRPASILVVGVLGGSLVSKGWHWYSDLPLGVALGYSFGRIAAHPEGLDVRNPDQQTSSSMSLSPLLLADGAAVQFSLRF